MKYFMLLCTLSIMMYAESMYNLCENGYVMKKKNNFSQIIEILKRDTKVEVLKKLDYYITSYHSETTQNNNLDKGDNSIGSQQNTKKDKPDGVPAWGKLKNGYISYKCLATVEEFKKIKEGKSRKSSSADTKIAKKGFSENESGDNVAMKGAAGKAKLGKANYASLDALNTIKVANPLKQFKQFRMNGHLGEYK